jgi:hypothetical protein
MLSIWDWIFSTSYRPVPGEEIVYGLTHAEHLDYDTIVGVYFGPISKIRRLLARSTSSNSGSASSSDGGRTLPLAGILWRKSSAESPG